MPESARRGCLGRVVLTAHGSRLKSDEASDSGSCQSIGRSTAAPAEMINNT